MLLKFDWSFVKIISQVEHKNLIKKAKTFLLQYIQSGQINN